MRHLTKAPQPDILTTKGPAMTAAYVGTLAGQPGDRRPWRHPEIVAGLIAETHAKCAYCEAVISDVAAPHVEHIIPKSVSPTLVVHWTNLTLACPACNSAKGTYFSQTAALLNPYDHQPSAH